MANYSDDLEKVYDDMISESEKHYQAQIDASKQWADTQSRLEQERTDFEISQIEREKEQTTKDYKKEQSGAYVDWQKESNRYGTNAEYMASNGLAGSGYSESSQVSMYNTYQNRVATARDTWTRAIQNYNDKITEARMQNSAALAQIAYQALQQQLELSLASFQYKSQLTQEKAAARAASRAASGGGSGNYLKVLDDIETEEIKAMTADGDVGNSRPTLKGSNTPAASPAGKNSRGSGLNAVYATTKAEENTVGKVSGTYKGERFNVNNEFYRGDLNPDALKYGVHTNGYQPKGIDGHGYLHKTGDSVVYDARNLNTIEKKVEETIWRADDGSYWYWNARKNAYVPYKG